MGMAHGDIPAMLGRVLSGTKYGVKQTRGKFGLGAKMALIWSKMSTGLPVEILSAPRGQSFVSYYKLDIDIHKCVPVRVQSRTGVLTLARLRLTLRNRSSTAAICYEHRRSALALRPHANASWQSCSWL